MRVTGELTRQLTVSPKPGALEALDASVLDLYRAIGKGNDIFPGGRINAGPRDLTVGIAAAALGADRLAQLPEPLAASSSVRVDDVATVSDGYADRSVLSRVDQDPAILLAVAHARGADAIRTIAAARKTVAALARRYPEIRFQELRTDAPYTSAALDGVLQTLGEGIALTVVVMLLFLHAWRNAGIAAIAIPASLCAAFATMWVLGFTINVLSLMGLGLILRRAYRGTVRDLLVTGGMAPLARCNDRCSHDFRALVAAARDGRDRDRVFAAGQPG